MKVLVDTCVWSLALRRRTTSKATAAEQEAVATLREAIEDRRAAILGPIRQEILSGIRDKAQFSKIETQLEPFRDEEIQGTDYVEAARIFNLCRSQGVECGPVDTLLLAVAVRLGFSILTEDKGLRRCMELLHEQGVLREVL